jgi:TPR repeat protein
MRRIVLYFSFMLLATPLLAIAGPFEDGMEAYRRGEFAIALELWQPLATQGDREAQFRLGLLYANGQGTPRDEAKGLKWTTTAAGQGYPPAQFALGLRHDGIYGTSSSAQEAAESVAWYRKAADQGHAISQYYLARKYSLGDGVARDDAEAVKWWRKAAERGYVPAQWKIGALHMMGLMGSNVPRDKVQAFKWFSIALAQPQEHFSGEVTRATVISSRNMVAQQMTPAEIAEAQAQSKDWRVTTEEWLSK